MSISSFSMERSHNQSEPPIKWLSLENTELSFKEIRWYVKYRNEWEFFISHYRLMTSLWNCSCSLISTKYVFHWNFVQSFNTCSCVWFFFIYCFISFILLFRNFWFYFIIRSIRDCEIVYTWYFLWRLWYIWIFQILTLDPFSYKRITWLEHKINHLNIMNLDHFSKMRQ